MELSAAQLRALASVARAEIVSALSHAAPLSARELAVRLGRPVSGLYHHIKALEQVGLLKAAGSRSSARRPEQLYALTAETLSSREAARSKQGRRALAATGRRFISAAARGFEAGLATREGRTEGAGRTAAVRRLRVCLGAADLAAFNAELDAWLARIQKRSRRLDGTTIDITLILAPVRSNKRRG